MSMPNIPDITPNIDLDREEAITLLLASIALEEMGLAHILNVEGEKMQLILKLKDEQKICLNEILAVNDSIERVIKSVTKLQIILQDKLDSVIRLMPKDSQPLPCPDHKPPKPKPRCKLVGCAIGCIKNSKDPFYGATATLDIQDKHSENHDERYPIKYTLFNKGKGCHLSSVILPIPDSIEIKCPDKPKPCPTPEAPYFLSMKGNAIMSIKESHDNVHQSTVKFNLKVWDYGIKQQFQMVTWGDKQIYTHDSGIVDVTQGNLQIKNISK